MRVARMLITARTGGKVSCGSRGREEEAQERGRLYLSKATALSMAGIQPTRARAPSQRAGFGHCTTDVTWYFEFSITVRACRTVASSPEARRQLDTKTGNGRCS